VWWFALFGVEALGFSAGAIAGLLRDGG
jgi:hypothetical protein